MSFGFTPGSSAQLPSTEVELTISARNLRGADILSKSDPFCVVYTQPFGNKEWVELHRTETIQNNHNPNFVSKKTMPYRFEEQQYLKFEIYDSDSTARNLSDHDFLGFAICTLGQLLSSGGKQAILPLQIRSDYGKIQDTTSSILINAEELLQNNDEVVMEFSGYKLDKKDWFGKSDPFLEIYKTGEVGNYILVHKTEVIKNTLNPRWKKFIIPLRILCNSDYKRTLKFTVWDWNSSGNHSLIGEFVSNIEELSTQVSKKFPLINSEKKRRKSSYTNSGEIILQFFEVQKVYSFMDYLTGGLQIHCTVSIDFTGSNGNPTDPSSLHYVCGAGLNCYEQAIISVVSIIEDYDSDKQFPVLGFGARLPPDGRVSHEFFVNMNPSNPYCSGVNGVLEAYRSCIRMVQLYGPTNFSPVIEHVITFARSYADGNNYFILLILTDGVISDMPQTIKSIVDASRLPISVIIVGIGNTDFSAMEILDGDQNALEHRGVKACRDIVQFVPFNKFLSQGDPLLIRQRLAKEVLAEVPKQVVSYMKYNGYVPQPKVKDPVNLPANPDLL